MNKQYIIAIIAAILFSVGAISQIAYALDCVKTKQHIPSHGASHHHDTNDDASCTCLQWSMNPDGLACRQILKEIKGSAIRPVPIFAKDLSAALCTSITRLNDYYRHISEPDTIVSKRHNPVFLLNAAMLC